MQIIHRHIENKEFHDTPGFTIDAGGIAGVLLSPVLARELVKDTSCSAPDPMGLLIDGRCGWDLEVR